MAEELALNTVHEGDCLELMRDIPDGSIDLVVTDPPYLMDYRSNRRVKTEKFRHIANDKDAHQLISDYIDECYRVLADNTAIYMFCSWHHIDFFKSELERHFKLKNVIVWNKNNHGSGDLKGAYAPKHEFILYGHKGRSLFREKRVPDVMDFAKIASKKLTHPTEKPTELLDVFIRNSSDAGDVVFDGFAGTGSTGISALRNKRSFIGCELDAEYHALANQRISDVYYAIYKAPSPPASPFSPKTNAPAG